MSLVLLGSPQHWDSSCLAPAGLAPQAASAAASASSPSRPIKMPKLPQPLWSSRSPGTRLHFQLSRCWNKCTSPATNPRNDSRQTMTRPYKTYIILYYIVLYYTIIYYSYLVTVSLYWASLLAMPSKFCHFKAYHTDPERHHTTSDCTWQDATGSPVTYATYAWVTSCNFHMWATWSHPMASSFCASNPSFCKSSVSWECLDNLDIVLTYIDIQIWSNMCP